MSGSDSGILRFPAESLESGDWRFVSLLRSRCLIDSIVRVRIRLELNQACALSAISFLLIRYFVTVVEE